MKLTPFAKIFITAVILIVLGFVTWFWAGDSIKKWATGENTSPKEDVKKEDFDSLKNPISDPKYNDGSTGVTAQPIGTGKLNRPLVVGINTWAGHAPGIVYNGGMEPSANSFYKKNFGMDVKFVLLEDPAAKLAAFRKGDIDIMWDTVDNWAREASLLAEQGQTAKSIIMQDWSRGGDGVVSLSSIKSIEDLKGKKIACTQFTPSHFLILYLLSQSGLTPDERNAVEKNIVFTQDASLAAAAFRSKNVDAAVTWEPDLSAAVENRNDAHILVSTSAATNVIADTLIARQDLIDKSPETVRDFVNGWFDGIAMMRDNPNPSNEIVAKALKLDADTVSGMLSGLKLTPFSDNAQFYGLTGAKPHYETLFDTAFVIWRKKGLVNKSVSAKDWSDARFVSNLAAKYPGQKVEEKEVVAKAPSKADVPILQQQIQIQFTPGSDEIMQGSYFSLDKLGELMTSFGGTVLRVEGNTDSTGAQSANATLSEKRANSVKNYITKNFPNIKPERFQTIGRGSTNPVAPNETEAGRQQNRRTDIKVILSNE